MALTTGTRLGPYEIQSSIGAGGMGEVYRARDTRLERTVAVKILPSEFSADAVRKQRFEREAKAISSLNHPHICVLHDIGHQDGIDYLVMECVEGESLAARLDRGPLPLEQVFKFGSQIADALAEAHRNGIVHRDLKPGNIILTTTGAKLLDFGLAKPISSKASADTLMTVPTGERPLTGEGSIVGTFQYMAPEQLEGKAADASSDIFALGAVLYEMATGKRAFDGKTQASVIAAILERDPPPISSLQPLVPRLLDRVVKACLAKNPNSRWQSAHDLKEQLDWMGQGETAISVVSKPSRFRWWIWIPALVVGAAALFATGYFSRTMPPQQSVRASMPPPPDASFTISSSVAGSLALSPDGRQLAFSAQAKGGAPQLWVRSLDTLVSHPLADTQDGFAPFWSPDGRWIAFFANGKLKKVEASGGPVETLCDAPLGRGGAWNSEGLIVFSPNLSQPLYSVPANGGLAKPLTQLDASRQEVTHRWPTFLPDGKHYIFFVRAAASSATGEYLGALGSDQHTQIISSATNAAYASPGYLMYGRGDVLLAQPFDVKKLQVTAPPLQVAQDVSMMPATNYGNFSVSQTGTLIYSSGSIELGRGLYWYDRQGKQLGKLGSPEYASWPQLSPDGKKMALRLWTQPAGNFEIWVYDLAREVHVRESFSALTAFAPVWSPEGQQLAYSHSAPQVSGDHMFLLSADGRGTERPLEQPILEAIANYSSSWSPDGASILFDRQDKAGKISIWVLPMSENRKPYPFIDTQFNAQMAKFSPDGRWVAYVSNDSGKDEVYVVPFPGPGARVQVSTSGGADPRWRGDGKEIFYLSAESKMTSADVRAGTNEFAVGTIRTLFPLSGLGGVPGYLYDVTSDGQKFIAVQDMQHTSTVPLTLVVNWPADLKN